MIVAEPGSLTGVYVWDAATDTLVKVSDKVRAKPDSYVPQGGYIDDNLGYWNQEKQRWIPREITSPEQKASLLAEKNLVEDGGWKKPRSFRPVTVDLGAK